MNTRFELNIVIFCLVIIASTIVAQGQLTSKLLSFDKLAQYSSLVSYISFQLDKNYLTPILGCARLISLFYLVNSYLFSFVLIA